MADLEPQPIEPEGERPIDRELVVGRLQEYGIPIELEDLEGEDDNDILGIIAGYVETFGVDVDMDDLFPETTPIEKRRRDELGEPTEIVEGDEDEV